MNRQLLLSVVILALTGSVALADHTRSTCEKFRGPYIGAAVGMGWHESEVTNLGLGIKVGSEDRGVMFGGYAGYNFEHCGHHVIGIEADFNYLNATANGTEVEFGPTGLVETVTLKSKTDWFGTLRGRAGLIVHDHMLLYATGGLAYARVGQSIFDDCVGCGNSPFNLGMFGQSNDKMKYGWTLGGGIEIAHDQRWLFRAETLYIDLGSNDRTYVLVTPAGTGISHNRWDDNFWIARVGFAYKFSHSD